MLVRSRSFLLPAVASAVMGLTFCLGSQASATDFTWTGATSTDASVASNWDLNAVPGSSDQVTFNTGATVDIGSGVTWGNIVFDGATAVTGTGTLTLDPASGVQAIFSQGGGTTTIAPDVSTTGGIQPNGGNNLTFNGTVNAGLIDAYGGTVNNFNGAASSASILEGTAQDNFNAGYTDTSGGSAGHNNGGTAYFSAISASSNLFNIYDGSTIGNLADNVFNSSTNGVNILFSRSSNGTYSLNGYSDSLFYLGNNSAQIFNIDFGSQDKANTLSWAYDYNAGGTYNVTDFQIGKDNLILGTPSNPGNANATFSAALLGTITIDGIGYSATPTSGVESWNLNASTDAVQFSNVPEPAALGLMGAAFMGLLLLRKRSLVGKPGVC